MKNENPNEKTLSVITKRSMICQDSAIITNLVALLFNGCIIYIASKYSLFDINKLLQVL